MEYIQNGNLYSNSIVIAQITELTKRNIKKIAFQKELGKSSTFCIVDAKKKDLKNILESEEIKGILEAKNIKYKMRL